MQKHRTIGVLVSTFQLIKLIMCSEECLHNIFTYLKLLHLPNIKEKLEKKKETNKHFGTPNLVHWKEMYYV